MIEVKFDPKIVLPTIEVPIYHEDKNNDPELGYDSPLQQTKIDGIETPLIRINNITVFFTQVKYIKLTCNRYPELQVIIEDSLGLIKSLDSPSNDNQLQLQILPPFDNTYKKINLTFFMTDVRISGSTIDIIANYYVPGLYNSIMKSYGKCNTYDCFMGVANDLSIGFSSNISSSMDERWIYNPNMNYLDFLEKEIYYSSGDGKGHVLECWIDWWNSLNIVDIYNEFNNIEKDENMMVWIPDMNRNMSDTTDKPNLIKHPAILSNNPMFKNTPLFISSYEPESSSKMITDMNYEVYNMNTLDRQSTVIMDGDIKNDIFIKYSYGGELFGKFDYLTQKKCRDIFINKLYNQTINVSIHKPILGMVKGRKVNLYWYETGNYMTESIIENDNISTNIPELPNVKTDEVNWILNKMVSGQYYILDCTIEYTGSGNQGSWNQSMKLARPADQINRYNGI